MFFTLNIFAASPSNPILPSDNIQDPGDVTTPWGGCGPTDNNCFIELTSFTNETVTGLDYSTSTGVLSLTAGYIIPTLASTTAWDNAVVSNSFSTSTSRNILSSIATGLTYSTTTGIFQLDAGYIIPTTASTTEWTAKQNAITTGTVSQYLRGDLSLATFPTALSEFTNDSGYLTSVAGQNISQFTNDSNYLTTIAGQNISELTNDANFISDLTSFSTDDLTQGSTNLYSQWGTSGSNVFYTGGNVGVGTSTPSAKLDVVGDFKLSNSATALVITGDNVGNARGALSVDIQSTHSSATRVASGAGAVAIGKDNSATNINSMSFGVGNTNTGQDATAIGRINAVSNTNAVGIGYGNTASGINSFALGITNTANNTNTFAIGASSIASTSNSFALGIGAQALAASSLAFGNGVINNTATSLMIGPSDAAKLTILSSGFVGIGTTTPLAKLSVGSGSLADANVPIQISTGGTGTEANYGVNKNGAYGFLLGYKNVATIGAISSASGGYLRQVTGDPFFMVVNNTRISTAWLADGTVGFGGNITNATTLAGANMYLSSTGNLGIGTTTPSAKLAITGTAGTGDIFAIASSTDSRYLTVTSAGNVGIGIPTSISNTLTVSGSASFESAAASGVGRIDFYGKNGGTRSTSNGYIASNAWTSTGGMIVQGTNILRLVALTDLTLESAAGGVVGLTLKNTGNIGIGTTTPSSKLSVVGDIDLNGALKINNDAGTSGYILQTTGTGAQWVATSTLGFGSGSSDVNTLSVISVGNTNTNAGTNASALGYLNNAQTLNSVLVGNQNFTSSGGYGSVALGIMNNSSGADIHISTGVITGTPVATTTVGVLSTSIGILNSAQGRRSSSLGFLNLSSGNESVSVGYLNRSTSNFSNALGVSNVSTNDRTSAIGYGNTSSITYASAFGYQNTASGGTGASAFGYLNTASAAGASAFGTENSVSTYRSSAFGYGNTITSTQYGTAIGYGNNVSGNEASAFGKSITNTVANSVMIGPSDAAKLTILSSGNLGVGTSTPLYKTHIYTNTNTENGLLIENINAGTTAAAAVYFKNNLGTSGGFNVFSSAYGVTHFRDRSSLLSQKGLDLLTNSSVASGGTDDMRFYTGGYASTNERMRILSSGNVGIGTTAPGTKLSIVASDNTTASTLTIQPNNLSGGIGLYYDGIQGLSSASTLKFDGGSGASGKMIFGGNTGGNMGFGTSNTSPGSKLSFAGNVSIGSSYYTTAASANGLIVEGNVGIGTTTPADKLQVFGDIRIGMAGSDGCIKDYAGTGIVGVCSSDERLKTNIVDLSDGYLDKLVNLKVITYNWNEEANQLNKVDTTVTNYGLLAQNVESIFPELVTTDSKGYKQVNYSRLPLYLLKSVQELSKKVIGFADEFRTKNLKTDTLCVGNTCITESELLKLLQNQNVQQVVVPTPTPNPEPIVAEEVTSTESNPIVEPVVENEETPEPTPVVEPELEPEPVLVVETPAPEPAVE